MDKPTSYCEAILHMDDDNVHRHYHDFQYGFPIHDDNELYGRLILEINQAGLSWTTILKKSENFRTAYSNFDISVVANYQQSDIDRLLNDAGIIRNRLKINAAIYNAQKLADIQSEHGSFEKWLDHHHPRAKNDWIKIFKKTFRFTGGEITNEFLMSTGYLEGAHIPDCPVYKEILNADPKWYQVK